MIESAIARRRDWTADARAYIGAIPQIVEHIAGRLGLECRLVGNQYQMINPQRQDAELGSFSINVTNGMWRDFADVSSKGGNDVFGFWKFCLGLASMTAAANEIESLFSGSRLETLAALKTDVRYTVIMPPPPDAGRPPLRIDNRHGAAHIFNYCNRDGQLLFVIGRWENEDGTKSFRQMSYVQYANGLSKWDWKGPGMRTLFGLEHLDNAKEVVLVEGEKKCVLARQTMGDPAVVWLSLSGGAAAVGKNDLTPLAGKVVTLWPDRDANGVAAMQHVARELRAMQCDVRVVDDASLSPMATAKWDVYDEIMTGGARDPELREIIMQAKKIDERLTAPPPRFGIDESPKLKDLKYPVAARYKTDEAGERWAVPAIDPVNFQYLIEQFGIECRRNLMSQEAELTFPQSFKYPELAESDTMVAIRDNHLETIRLRCSFPEKNFIRWIGMHADQHCYHPVVNWIGPTPAHGVATFERLVDALGGPTPRDERRFKLLRWMISALAVTYRRRLDPNGGPPKTHGILALVGPQGNGKSTFISALAPASMVMDGAHFIASNKDSLIENTMRWIVEWAEVGATMSRSSSEEIKSFSSRGTDFYRRPYATKSEHVPRRTVFAATVNTAEFLKDDENRRWWVIETDGSLDAFHHLDMHTVWREVLGLYLAGEPWWLAGYEADENRTRNVGHRERSAVAELISSSFNWSIQTDRAAMNASDVLRMLDLPLTKQHRNEAASALNALGDEGLTHTRTHHGTRVWRVPMRLSVLSIDTHGRE